MHVVYFAQLLHNCALRVRAYSENKNDVAATIKPATTKNKTRTN